MDNTQENKAENRQEKPLSFVFTIVVRQTSSGKTIRVFQCWTISLYDFLFPFFRYFECVVPLKAQELTEAYPKWISSWNLNWLIFAVATAIFYHYTITICFSLIIIKNSLCRDVPPSSKITLLSMQHIKKSNKNSTLQTYKPLSTNLADRTLDRTLVKQKGLGNYPAVVYLSKTTTLCINFRKLFTNIRNNNLTEPRRATRSPQNLHHRYVESRVLFRAEAFV